VTARSCIDVGKVSLNFRRIEHSSLPLLSLESIRIVDRDIQEKERSRRTREEKERASRESVVKIKQ
jgi:hypothetical protein